MSEKQIKMYTSPVCPFCIRAKMWLKNKQLPFEEIVIEDAEKRQELYASIGNGVRSVPQIFLGEDRIGGYDELVKSDIVERYNS